MTIIYGALTFLVFIFIVVNIKQYRNIRASIAFITLETRKPLRGKRQKRFIFLIPVLDEHTIIQETIAYFSRILAAHPTSRLVFITTQREGGATENKTWQQIQPYLSEQIGLIHYPLLTGNKAHQINYAVAQLQVETGEGGLPVYYAIFDADSRPDIRGCEYIAQDTHDEKIYQMLPVYSTNFARLSLLGKASAIFQTRWMMSHELPSLLENHRRQRAVNLSYCVGHGLFIEARYFAQHPLPTETVTEDLLFGYQAVMNHVYARPTPYFDYCSTVALFPVSVRQAARWHAGDITSLLKLMREKNTDPHLRLLQVRRLFQMLQWPFGPLLTAAALCCLLVLNCWPAVLLMLALIGCYVCVLHCPVMKLFFRRGGNPLGLYSALLLKSAVNCTGALYSYFLRVNPNVDFWFKTPR